MGLFNLPAPIFSFADSLLAGVVPPLLRLVLWGIFAGWLTMLAYRLFSNQEKLGSLKAAQKDQNNAIAEFDGEFAELLPLIRDALALGIRQLGLALGPALLATVPALLVIIWVAGAFAYEAPVSGSEVLVNVEPATSEVRWSPTSLVRTVEDINDETGWLIEWPSNQQSLTLSEGQTTLLVLPLTHDVPIIHKKRWWNLLMANPLGYLPQEGETRVVRIELPEKIIIGAGPDWMRGWMFSFFMAFLLSSVAFKFLLRLD
jgi:hypothetical protein